jgi:hypothetical protein
MRRIIGCLFLLFLGLNAQAQTLKFELKNGDLIFQDLDCGPMCDAIEAVTEGYKGQKFSHVGLVWKKGNTIQIIEALSKGVDTIPLEQFMLRDTLHYKIGRVLPPYQKLIPKAIQFATQQLGKPYDVAFTYGNEAYYCSELIYDAFLYANKGKTFFQLFPMTFKQPQSETYFPVWVDYFNKLGIPIPEGELGCNPGGLSQSTKIKIVYEK